MRCLQVVLIEGVHHLQVVGRSGLYHLQAARRGRLNRHLMIPTGKVSRIQVELRLVWQGRVVPLRDSLLEGKRFLVMTYLLTNIFTLS